MTIKTTVVRQPDSTYPIVINPYRLYVSKAGEVEVDEAKFTITNVSDQDVDLSIVSQPYGYFKLDIPDKIKAGKSVEAKLKVNEEFLSSAFEKSITLEVGDMAQSRFSIPVIRRFIGTQKPAAQETAGGH